MEEFNARKWFPSWRLALFTLVIAVVVITATGCGGSKEGATATTAGAAAAAAGSAELEYVKCMRENGIDLADPVVGADGTMNIPLSPDADGNAGAAPSANPRFAKAEQTCRKHLEAASDGAEENVAEFQDAALAFAKCMRKEGVDIPDPKIQGSTVRLSPPSNPNDPKVEQATKACVGLLPTPPGS